MIHRNRDLAVIDQKARALFERLEDFRMGQANTMLVALFPVEVEAELLTDFQLIWPVFKFTAAQLWSLQIGKNGNRTSCFTLDLADDFVTLGDITMAPMAHVQAKDICTGIEKGANGFVV